MEQTEQKYGVRRAILVMPVGDLLVVPHRGVELVVSHPAFGPNTYANNIVEMQRTYVHSEKIPQVSFRAPTTSESISAAAYEFRTRAMPEIFNVRWLQAGKIIRTSEGVFANPLDNQGNVITDIDILKRQLEGARKIKVGNGHVYLGDNDFGFAEYESFIRGVQDCDTFAQGGLARVLEHTKEAAVNLRAIASPENYRRGVNVWGFEPVSELVEIVLDLGFDRDGGRFYVDGYWDDDCVSGGGYAFGVLDSGKAGTPKK